MKTFFSTLAGLVIVGILAAVIVGFVFWSRLPDMVSNHLSKKLKVAVEIDSFGLSWGKISARNIQIGNPPGSLLARALTCKEIDILAPITHYLKKRIVIDEIDLKDIYLGLEFDSASSTSGNWSRIIKNLQDSTGGALTSTSKDKRKSKKETPPPTTSGRSVLIHRIVLTNIDVDVIYRKEGGKVKRLPRIPRMELTEISSEGGLPMDQILNSVLVQMLKEVFIKENLNNMIKEFMDTPSPIQKYIQPFKGFFNAVSEETDAIVARA